jgi:hypothetical protein
VIPVPRDARFYTPPPEAVRSEDRIRWGEYPVVILCPDTRRPLALAWPIDLSPEADQDPGNGSMRLGDGEVMTEPQRAYLAHLWGRAGYRIADVEREMAARFPGRVPSRETMYQYRRKARAAATNGAESG